MKSWVPAFCVSGVLALFLGAGFAGAQMPRHPAPPSPSPLPAMGIYEGESSAGNFQEALNEAVSQASRAEKGVFRYEVSHIGGEFGGPGSIHTLKVQISTGSRPKMPIEVAK